MECQGSQMCLHGRRKDFCKECKGSQICSHGRRKFYCKECKGSQICQHNHIKQSCKQCKGSQICPHNRAKPNCKECKGSQICPHNRLKSHCKECKGSQICTHGRKRSYCKPCNGSQICQHGKVKAYCVDCGGNQLCQLCHFTQISRDRKICAKCLPKPFHNSPYKEIKLAARLRDWAREGVIQMYSFWNKQNPLADPTQCGNYRVDFIFELHEKVVLLECDENQHCGYDKRCEFIRQAKVSLGFGGLPIYWIRYNPDVFRLDGRVHSVKKNDRESVLLKMLQLALSSIDFDHFITLIYICYNKSTPASGTMEDDLCETFKFKNIEDYTEWVEQKTPT
jgi:hypothetical protein